MGSTASAVATMSSALCRRPPTTIRPSIFPATKIRPAGPMNPSRPVLVKGNSLMGVPLLDTGKTCRGFKDTTCKQNAHKINKQPKHSRSHLERVLGHTGQAVIRGPRGNSTNAHLSDLVCFTELGNTFELHYTHQTYRQKDRRSGKSILTGYSVVLQQS